MSTAGWAWVSVLACVSLTGCFGLGGGDDLKVDGRAVNGVAEAAVTARTALEDYAERTGVGIDNAECHLRVVEKTEAGDTVRYPERVDCLPVAFLGDGGMNTVSFPAQTIPDPERPNDFTVEVVTASPFAGRFDPAGASFTPALPDELPDAGVAVVPGGSVQIGDRIVAVPDLRSFRSMALAEIANDTSHAAEVKFTMADEPTCLFTPDLTEAWCGPGVSLISPDGEVARVAGIVPSISISDYSWSAAEVVVQPGVAWEAYGSQPGNLIDMTGVAASLPTVDSFDGPDVPTIDVGYFAEVTDEPDAFRPCLKTGRTAGLCDDISTSRFETQPNYLYFVSGSLHLVELGIAETTGSADTSPIDTERAPVDASLVAFTAELVRNDAVAGSEPVNAEVLVGDEVVASWGGVTGARSFFLSLPSNAPLRIRLVSGSEIQDLVVKNGNLTRATERPELYATTEVRFSRDQPMTGVAGLPATLEVRGLEGENPTTSSFIVIDQRPIAARPGYVFLGVRFTGAANAQLVAGKCNVVVLLPDDVTVRPAQETGDPCVQQGADIRVIFEIPADAQVRAFRIEEIETTAGTIESVTVPTVSG